MVMRVASSLILVTFSVVHKYLEGFQKCWKTIKGFKGFIRFVLVESEGVVPLYARNSFYKVLFLLPLVFSFGNNRNCAKLSKTDTIMLPGMGSSGQSVEKNAVY